MAANDLRDLLLGLPELTLIGTALLAETPSVGFFPADGLPREMLRSAVAEMVAYTDRCGAAARRLRGLTPIPVGVPVPAYAL